MQDSVSGYVEQALKLLGTAGGIAAILGLLFLIFMLRAFPWVRWVTVAVLLFSTTFGATGDFETGAFELAPGQLVFPLTILQTYARQITLGLALALLVPTMASSRGNRRQLLPLGVLFFFALELWGTMRGFGGDTTLRSVVSAFSFTLLILTLGVGLGSWLQDTADAVSLVKALALCGVLFVLANLYQLARNPSSAVLGRYAGTTCNAQTIGQVTAMLVPSLLYLVFRKDMAKFWRLFCAFSAGFMLLFLLWSGSRTGMLMLVGSVLLLFRRHAKRLVAAGILVGAVLWLAMHLFPESASNLARFIDPTNTREESWRILIAKFWTNPVFGTGFGSYLESTPLSTLAAYGIIGFILLFASAATIFRDIVKMIGLSRASGGDTMFPDLLLANFAAIAACLLFESSILGVFNHMVPFFYINMALLCFMVDQESLRQERALYAGADTDLMPADTPAPADAPPVVPV